MFLKLQLSANILSILSKDKFSAVQPLFRDVTVRTIYIQSTRVASRRLKMRGVLNLVVFEGAIFGN